MSYWIMWRGQICRFKATEPPWHRTMTGYPGRVPVRALCQWGSRSQRSQAISKGYTMWLTRPYYSFHDEIFFACFVLFLAIPLNSVLFWGGGHKDRGKGMRMSRIRMHGVKSTDSIRIRNEQGNTTTDSKETQNIIRSYLFNLFILFKFKSILTYSSHPLSSSRFSPLFI